MQQKKLILILIAIGINFSLADTKSTPSLGQEATPEEIAILDISVFPDGEGLPEGEGGVHEGGKYTSLNAFHVMVNMDLVIQQIS